jgi:hypothetical protein
VMRVAMSQQRELLRGAATIASRKRRAPACAKRAPPQADSRLQA